MFHIRWEIWLINAVNFFIFYSPETVSNDILITFSVLFFIIMVLLFETILYFPVKN